MSCVIADRLFSSTTCSSSSSSSFQSIRSQRQQRKAIAGSSSTFYKRAVFNNTKGRGRGRRGGEVHSHTYLSSSCRHPRPHHHRMMFFENTTQTRVTTNTITTTTGKKKTKKNRSSIRTSALFDPLKFDPDRVSVSFCEDSVLNDSPTSLLKPRRYTLTHNDLTRHLTLSVSKEFNETQTSIWYTKLLRDEVLAEWRSDGLHVFCQVSADGAWWIRWAAPLRAIVFRQKLPLVLDTLRYAERNLFQKHPELLETPVYVNFSSVESARKNRGESDKEYWGLLKDAGGKNELRLKVNERNDEVDGSSSSSSSSVAAAGAGEDDLETMLELSRARAEKESVPPQYQREEFELPLNTINSVNEEEKENIASSKPR